MRCLSCLVLPVSFWSPGLHCSCSSCPSRSLFSCQSCVSMCALPWSLNSPSPPGSLSVHFVFSVLSWCQVLDFWLRNLPHPVIFSCYLCSVNPSLHLPFRNRRTSLDNWWGGVPQISYVSANHLLRLIHLMIMFSLWYKRHTPDARWTTVRNICFSSARLQRPLFVARWI